MWLVIHMHESLACHCGTSRQFEARTCVLCKAVAEPHTCARAHTHTHTPARTPTHRRSKVLVLIKAIAVLSQLTAAAGGSMWWHTASDEPDVVGVVGPTTEAHPVPHLTTPVQYYMLVRASELQFYSTPHSTAPSICVAVGAGGFAVEPIPNGLHLTIRQETGRPLYMWLYYSDPAAAQRWKLTLEELQLSHDHAFGGAEVLYPPAPPPTPVPIYTLCRLRFELDELVMLCSDDTAEDWPFCRLALKASEVQYQLRSCDSMLTFGLHAITASDVSRAPNHRLHNFISSQVSASLRALGGSGVKAGI